MAFCRYIGRIPALLAAAEAPLPTRHVDEDPGTWRDDGWRQGRRLSKVHEQVFRLFWKTRGMGVQWEVVEVMLDTVVGWAEADWEKMSKKKVDHLLVPASVFQSHPGPLPEEGA
tara:strand:- start:383 stop:724 length:342 start_codon:yes stop_codon:yes gene_type:complete